jgi:hypothetical protein
MDMGIDSTDFSIFNQKLIYCSLPNIEVALKLQYRLHLFPVEITIVLGSRTLNSKTLSGVKPPELNAGPIRILGHLTSQGIDLFNEVTLGQSPDSGITAHDRNVVQIHGEEQSGMSHTGGGQRGLTSGVAPSHNNDIICFFTGNHKRKA